MAAQFSFDAFLTLTGGGRRGFQRRLNEWLTAHPYDRSQTNNGAQRSGGAALANDRAAMPRWAESYMAILSARLDDALQRPTLRGGED
jgi:hypothetical protein